MTKALTIEEKTKTLRGVLSKMEGQLQAALPKGMMADRMCRIAMTTLQKSPKLLDCSMLSIVSTIMESCQLGLALDGVLGHAYPVPFAGQCQMMVGYRGFALLAYRSAEITIEAELVREHDEFDYLLGTESWIRHKPAFNAGEVTHAYAVGKFPDGRSKFVVMTRADIEDIQKMSKAKGKDSPWKTNWDEMARKTPIRRLAKLLPLTGDFLKYAVIDEQREQGVSGSGSESFIDLSSIDAEFASTAKKDTLKKKLQDAKKDRQTGDSTGAATDEVQAGLNPATDQPTQKELDDSRPAF